VIATDPGTITTIQGFGFFVRKPGSFQLTSQAKGGHINSALELDHADRVFVWVGVRIVVATCKLNAQFWTGFLLKKRGLKKLMDESWENKSKPWWHETCFPGGENRIIN